jgi:hypothetical protein
MKLPSSEQVQINALAEVVGKLSRRVHCLEKAHAEAGHSEWDKPAETWRDVTGECEWDGCYTIAHRNGGPCGDECATGPNGYRLRKVTLYAGYCSPTQVDAFIIEKREGA